MDTKELLRKVRKIEIKTKRLSDHLFSGEYHSSFKGRGMTFSEVREYQYGDDVRAIDWNVTARYNSPFVKIFEEERELTMMLLVDVSGSESFGTAKQTKRETITEICATLAFSAIQNNDKVGLLLFSDMVELYIPPKKGTSHVLRIIRELLEFTPKSRKTNISEALQFLSNVLKRKAITFILSDFDDIDYLKTLRIASRKHDITGVRVYDRREVEIPNLGMIELLDNETGERSLVNTSSKKIRDAYRNYYRDRLNYYQESFTRSGSGTMNIRADESFVKKMMGYFKHRSK